MRSESKAEKNGEEVCGSRVWAKAWPLGVWIRLSQAASHDGVDVGWNVDQERELDEGIVP